MLLCVVNDMCFLFRFLRKFVSPNDCYLQRNAFQMNREEFCRRFKNWKTEDLLNILLSAEKMEENMSTAPGRELEDVLLSYFMIFQNGNVVREHLLSLVDALMDHEARHVKKDLEKRLQQFKTSPPKTSIFNCPSCDCVFDEPITLSCGHTICQDCLQRKSDTIGAVGRSDGNLTFCPPCGNHSNEEALCVNIVLSDIIRKRFPENAKQVEANKRLGQSHLSSRSPRQAVESFSVALHISPKDYDCLCLRSDAYSNLKLDYLALRDVNNACSLRPDLPDAFHKKAKILTKMKKYDDAILEFLHCAALAATEPRRDELTESLFRLFTSPDMTRLEQKIIARKLTNILMMEERPGIPADFDRAESSSEEGSVTSETSHRKDKVNIDIDELKCSICVRLLFHPVTTQCGHTFCQECIKESLEYGPKCPSCGKTLNDSNEKKRNFTVVLNDLSRIYLEAQYMEREELHAKKVQMWRR